MAIDKSWGGLGVAAGTTVTTSTAGTGDTPFNAVTGTAPVTANALLRWPALQFDQLAAATSYVQWTITARAAGAIRWLAQYTGFAAASVSLLQGLSGGGAAQQWRIEMAGTGGVPPGEVRLRDAANALSSDSGATGIPAGGVVYCEFIWNAGVGTFNLYLPGVLTPSFTVTGAVGATAVDTLRIGNMTTTTQPRFFIDDLAVSDTAAPLGQAGTPGGTGETLQAALNRVAGTTDLGTVGAANRWAFTSNLGLVAALNVKAGTSDLGLRAVLNRLAGTQGLGVDGAASRLVGG